MKYFKQTLLSFSSPRLLNCAKLQALALRLRWPFASNVHLCLPGLPHTILTLHSIPSMVHSLPFNGNTILYEKAQSTALLLSLPFLYSAYHHNVPPCLGFPEQFLSPHRPWIPSLRIVIAKRSPKLNKSSHEVLLALGKYFCTSKKYVKG